MLKNKYSLLYLVFCTFLFILLGCADEAKNISVKKVFIKTPQPLPKETISVTYDIGNNYWCLTSKKHSNKSVLNVLVADSTTWKKEYLSDVPIKKWHTVLADEHGILWLASKKNLWFLNPRNPKKGWTDFQTKIKFPKGVINNMIIGNSGFPLIALSSGYLIKTNLIKKESKTGTFLESHFTIRNIPKQIKKLYINDQGFIVCKNEKTSIELKPNNLWRTHWEQVARIPGSNHDLRGDVLNGKFYMAGGLTAEYGYPMTDYVYSKLFEFDTSIHEWQKVAELGKKRIYCATGVLGKNLWVMGGDIIDENGKRFTTNLAQKINPITKTVENTVPLNYKLPDPIAFNVNGQLYILGYKAALLERDTPLIIESINEDNLVWKAEQSGPLGKGALYGCLIQNKICAVVANKYVAIFNTDTKKWFTINTPHKVRSPQVAEHNGELWVLGGRDIDNQAEVNIYNFENKTWRQGPDLPRELAWGVGFTINNDLYVTGGAAGFAYNNRTFRLKTE